MVFNTTCECNACANIGTLDLKFFVHHGTFSIQKLSTQEELVGHEIHTPDTKNEVKERTLHSYSLSNFSRSNASPRAAEMIDRSASCGAEAGRSTSR